MCVWHNVAAAIYDLLQTAKLHTKSRDAAGRETVSICTHKLLTLKNKVRFDAVAATIAVYVHCTSQHWYIRHTTHTHTHTAHTRNAAEAPLLMRVHGVNAVCVRGKMCARYMSMGRSRLAEDNVHMVGTLSHAYNIDRITKFNIMWCTNAKRSAAELICQNYIMCVVCVFPAVRILSPTSSRQAANTEIIFVVRHPRQIRSIFSDRKRGQNTAVLPIDWLIFRPARSNYHLMCVMI